MFANTQEAMPNKRSGGYDSPIESPVFSKRHLSPSLCYEVDAAADQERISEYLTETYEQAWFSTYTERYHDLLVEERPPVPLSPSLFYDVDAAADQERIYDYLTHDQEPWPAAYIQSHYDSLTKERPPVPLSPSASYDEGATKWDWERIVANADLSGYPRGKLATQNQLYELP